MAGQRNLEASRQQIAGGVDAGLGLAMGGMFGREGAVVKKGLKERLKQRAMQEAQKQRGKEQEVPKDKPEVTPGEFSHEKNPIDLVSQDEEGLNNFIKAVYGETVDDPEIMKAAKAWIDLTEELRTDFNARGGSISKNESWLFPQNHDMRSITKAGKKEWIGFISNRLDRSKMLDDLGKPLDDDQLAEALSYVYETITTGGANKAKGLSVPRGLGNKLSRAGSEQRFLYFKDADGWISYQNKFGKGDVFTTLTDHIQGRANDIALIETLGTNPRVMYDALKFQAEKLASEAGKPLGEAYGQQLDAVFKTVSGEINGGNWTTLADGVQFVRNLQVASKLGGAFLASFTDIATASLTANYNNISAAKVFKRHMQLFSAHTVCPV